MSTWHTPCSSAQLAHMHSYSIPPSPCRYVSIFFSLLTNYMLSAHPHLQPYQPHPMTSTQPQTAVTPIMTTLLHFNHHCHPQCLNWNDPHHNWWWCLPLPLSLFGLAPLPHHLDCHTNSSDTHHHYTLHFNWHHHHHSLNHYMNSSGNHCHDPLGFNWHHHLSISVPPQMVVMPTATTLSTLTGTTSTSTSVTMQTVMMLPATTLLASTGTTILTTITTPLPGLPHKWWWCPPWPPFPLQLAPPPPFHLNHPTNSSDAHHNHPLHFKWHHHHLPWLPHKWQWHPPQPPSPGTTTSLPQLSHKWWWCPLPALPTWLVSPPQLAPVSCYPTLPAHVFSFSLYSFTNYNWSYLPTHSTMSAHMSKQTRAWMHKCMHSMTRGCRWPVPRRHNDDARWQWWHTIRIHCNLIVIEKLFKITQWGTDWWHGATVWYSGHSKQIYLYEVQFAQGARSGNGLYSAVP